MPGTAHTEAERDQLSSTRADCGRQANCRLGIVSLPLSTGKRSTVISLARCESCGRRARLAERADDDVRCEFCGGRLRSVWGLAQLGQRTRSVPGGSGHLQESQVREALYGRPESSPGQQGGDGTPEPGAGEQGDDWRSPGEP
jgi:ribosomal protein S27E